jgi:hypothetical protein
VRLGDARKAIAEENWTRAREAAEAALKLDPANADAKKLKLQSERELKNELRYQAFTAAASKKDWAKIAESFRQIDRESLYRVKAQPDHDRLRDEYVQEVSAQGAKFAQAGKCKFLTSMARKAGSYWDEAGKAARAYDTQCKRELERRAGGQPPGGGAGPSGGGQEPPGGGGAVVGPSGPAPTSAELAEQAAAAYTTNQYAQAYKLCEQALAQDAGNEHARKICIVAACKQKKPKNAEKHFAKASPETQRLAAGTCRNDDIILSP